MSKRTIVNLCLIGLVIFLTMYINKNPVRVVNVIDISTLTPEEVDTIVIQRQDESQIILEKTDQNWLVSSPLEGKADRDKLSLLLRLLSLKSQHQHKITEQKQLNRYELLNPKVSLFLNDQQFDFGNTNDFNQLRYVLHDGTVHSVKDITHHLLISDVDTFLSE